MGEFREKGALRRTNSTVFQFVPTSLSSTPVQPNLRDWYASRTGTILIAFLKTVL